MLKETKIKYKIQNTSRLSSRQAKYKTGFTIVEIIIALGILAVGLFAVIGLFPKGIKVARESKETSVATNLAQEKIEEYLALNYDDIPTGIVEGKARVDNDPQSQFYPYQREVNVDYADSNLGTSAIDTGLKKIYTTVYWIESGTEKNIQIVRLLNKR